MMNRFTGPEGHRRLIEALLKQEIVAHKEKIARELAKVAKVRPYKPGAVLMKEGGRDNHICFLLSGLVTICIKRREINKRHEGQHVGEMTMLNHGEGRSAKVEAISPVVAACVSETHFSRLALKYPDLWKKVAQSLATRLRERSQHIRWRNETPILFLGSSRESLPVTRAVDDLLAGGSLITRVWNKGVFGASSFPIDDLEREIHETDFGALILGPDDRVISRRKLRNAPRDNVIFELGLSMGACGRKRSFLIVPRDLDVKIPSDLLGLTPLHYEYGNGRNLKARLKAACDELKVIIACAGPR